MGIQKVSVYQTPDGKQFATVVKAIEHNEELVREFLVKGTQHYAYTEDAIPPLTSHILTNRKQFLELLDFSSNPKQFIYNEDG